MPAELIIDASLNPFSNEKLFLSQVVVNRTKAKKSNKEEATLL